MEEKLGELTKQNIVGIRQFLINSNVDMNNVNSQYKKKMGFRYIRYD